MSDKSYSEEDVRQSVSQYLGELNLELAQIKHEETVGPIKIFSNVELKIKGKNRKSTNGRIDIIVRSENGNPLFVIETKKPSVEITSGKEQAISYARLLLAPLVVLTNGKDTVLLDPFTTNGDVIENVQKSNYFKNGCNITLGDDARYEALSNFIGYDLENLQSFCESQRLNRMNNLTGDLNDLGKKFIVELFVPPENLDNRFSEFLQNDKKVFFIHGESGIGKTNSMCYLANRYGEEYPVLFLNGSLLVKPIQDEIENDFNYQFSAEKSIISIIKKIERLINNHSTQLIVFIDAVDEYTISDAQRVIASFFRELQDKKIKLVLSSKTTRLQDFLWINDLPVIASSYDEFICKRMNDAELNNMLKKYASIFRTSGQLNDELKESCRQPMFCRVLHEVYENQTLPNAVLEKDLFESFLTKKLSKIPPDCMFVVKSLLQKMVQKMFDSNDITISNGELLTLIPGTTQYVTKLIDHNVLSNDGSQISFYYDRLRDYILTFEVQHWHEASSDSIYNLVNDAIPNKIGKSAVMWYFGFADESQKEIMLKFIHLGALEFIQKYESFINQYFKTIKAIFDPYTKKRMGLIISQHKESKRILSYALKEIKENDEPIEVLIKESYEDAKNESFERGAITTHGGFFDFASKKEIERIVKSDIFSQLDIILDQRLLLEGKNLRIERLLKFMIDYNIELGYDDLTETFWDDKFPIDLVDFKGNLLHLAYWAKNSIPIFNEKYRDKYPGTKDYGIRKPYKLDMMTSLMHSEYDKIKKLTEEDVKKSLLTQMVVSDTQVNHMILTIDELISQQRIIENPLLPFGDLKIESPRRGAWSIREYSNDQLSKYIEEFFRLYLIEYRKLIEMNFPDMKDKLLDILEFPTHVVVSFERGASEHLVGEFTYAIISNSTTDSDVIEVYYENGEIFDSTSFTVKTKFGVKKITSISSIVMSSIFEELALQNWCYDTLKNGLKEIFPELR